MSEADGSKNTNLSVELRNILAFTLSQEFQAFPEVFL